MLQEMKEEQEFNDQTIEEFAMTVRTYSVLKRNGINFASQIKAMSLADISGLKNIHRKCIEELEDLLVIKFT